MKMIGIVIAAAIAMGACSEKKARVTADAARGERREALQVRVDERVELLCIVMRLAGVEEYRLAVDAPYVRAVDAHFAAFREHPAVVAARELRRERAIGYDAPMSLAAHLDGVPELRLVVPLEPHPEALDPRWKQVDVEAYLAKLRDFARASDFAGFWAAQAAHRRAVEDRLRAHLSRHDLVGWFRPLGATEAPPRVTVVPGLLTGTRNYGAWRRASEGLADLLPIVMLEDVDEAGVPRPTDATTDLVVHEIAHAYVNPLVDHHAAALEAPAQTVFALVREAMTRSTYGHWSLMVRESIVRALVALHVGDARGAAARTREIEAQEDLGFVWTADVVAVLERARASGQELAAAFPAVVDLWRELASRYASGLPPRRFRGPINALFERRAEVVLVTPSSKAAPALAAYVMGVRAKLFAGSRVLDTDRTAIADLGTAPAVVWGSPATSPLVRDLVSSAGATVDASGVAIAGRRFDGAGFALIVAVPHPAEPTRGVVLYAADVADELAGINSMFHGPTDWVVARREGPEWRAVATGDL